MAATEREHVDHLIPMKTLPNLRDIGGVTTADGGTVRTGLLYRSTDLYRLNGEDATHFQALGINTIFDLRTEEERTREPDVVPEGSREVVLDVLAGVTGIGPAALLDVMKNPQQAQETLGGGKAVELFRSGYRQVVMLPSALNAYSEFFRAIDDPQNRPALFHCTTGKDRTGWAAAATLTLLGVSRDDVMADYLDTNRDLLPALQPMFDRFAKAGGDPELLKPVFGVDPRYLDEAFATVDRQFGSMDRYFARGLRIDDARRERLIDTFVQRHGATTSSS